MREFYLELEEIIKKALEELYPEREFSFFLESPRNKKFGDLALSLPLKLSSEIGKSPLEIAKTLKEKLVELFLKENPGIEKVTVIPPGFVNFFLKDKTVRNLLKDLLRRKERFFKRKPFSKKKILLEFVSANPTGPLSIAHGRQAIIGDVLANLFSFFGAEVVREYYINDEGTQIDLFVESVIERIKELKGEPFKIPEGGYYGEYVKEIANKLLGEKIEAKEKIRDFSLSLVLKEIKEDLLKLGIEFDNWVSQRKLQERKAIEKVINRLKEKGLTYQENGALWFKSTLFGDDKDRVLVRKDNSFTYFSADIAYHQDKLRRGFNFLINLWGPDHHGYIKRLKSALKALADKKRYDFEVIIVQLVTLKSKEKMSKRLGTALFLRDLISTVGKDAVRFFYLLRKNSSHLEFDLEKALSKSFDNPLYYIQYAHARICSIIEKSKKFIEGEAKEADKFLHLLKEAEELSLVKEIFQFKNILEVAYLQLEPYFVVDYLKRLASSFHKFYENFRVLIEEDRDLTKARLALIEGLRITLNLGLKLLGIEAPSRM